MFLGVGDEEYGITLVNLDRVNVISLSTFVSQQTAQAELVLSQLFALREICVEIVWESCAVSSDVTPVPCMCVAGCSLTFAAADCRGDGGHHDGNSRGVPQLEAVASECRQVREGGKLHAQEQVRQRARL